MAPFRHYRERERPGIGKLSLSIEFLLLLMKTYSKTNENRRMYDAFAVKTRKNTIHCSDEGDKPAKRRVLAVRTPENVARATFF